MNKSSQNKRKNKNHNNNNVRSAPSNQRTSTQSRSKGPRNPGPPMGPAPSQQPQNRPAVNLNKIRKNSVQKVLMEILFKTNLQFQKHVGPVDMSVLNVPEGGVSQSIRKSMAVTDSPRPVPGGGRPRPKPRAVKKLPQVKALWEYKGQDLDEISFEEGDTFDLIAEGIRTGFIKPLKYKQKYFQQMTLVGGKEQLMGKLDFFLEVMLKKFDLTKGKVHSKKTNHKYEFSHLVGGSSQFFTIVFFSFFTCPN